MTSTTIKLTDQELIELLTAAKEDTLNPAMIALFDIVATRVKQLSDDGSCH